MNYGKLTEDQLKENVFKYCGARRSEVIVGAQFGEDSAAMSFEGQYVVMSSDPITGATDGAGRLAVIVSANDVVANGAEPVALLLTILLPTNADASVVTRIMSEADKAAKAMNIEIAGGHTEYTDAVNRPIVSATAIGKAKRLINSSGVKVGNDLVLTKGAGIEGTAILFSDYATQLSAHFGAADIECGRSYFEQLSIVPEGRIAAQCGANAMHDVTEGGVLGAIYELSSAGNYGVTVDADAIAVSDVTHKLCEHLGIDVLRLISSGSLLVAIDDGAALVTRLKAEGIAANVIGKITAHPEKTIHYADGGRCTIEKPRSDELWRAIEVLKKC